ncbi:toll-like receptor 2 [Hyla sarda]|uniref:toll-like receptor 2 n=1 Tax=Hyla sarda TaxID=327740 RepID=UPI0024C2C7AF|nr:toll-like receptor 2 [Hyla sarda]XP_056418442.1 toll-like receptor 2 [Hyla sarda]XP_056418449.1 toll-like receptor 2 [Hyla sarda]
MVHYLLNFCLIFSLVKTTFSRDEADCHCDYMDFCDCSSIHLHSIPSMLPRYIKGLDLSNNLIQTISDDELKPYENLRVLRLYHNEIHTISNNAFQTLRNLEELDLSNNNLSNLTPTWFAGLPKLTHLNLLGNHYTSLGKTPMFSSLHSLRNLRIGNSDFVALDEKDFDGVLSLDELYLNMSHLISYTKGAIQSIQHTGHVTVAVNLTLLPEIISDLTHSATWLEIRDTSFYKKEDSEALVLLNDTTVKTLMYKDCLLTDLSTARLVEIVHTYKNVTTLALEDSELLGTGKGLPHLKDENSSISTIIIKNLYIPNFYLFTDFHFIYQMVRSIKSVTCINSKVFLMPCNFSRSFKKMEYLDLSENVLTDLFLGSSACYFEGYGAWPSLQTLNISKNLLTSLTKVSNALATITTLTYIDVSHNMFDDTTGSSCRWPKNLAYLNISNCKLKLIDNCLPVTLEVLDVSGNHLEEFASYLPSLKELYMSDNRLAMLPVRAYLPSLTLLVMRKNRLNDFFTSDLRHFPNMTSLDGSDNNYFCSCQFVDFAKHHSKILLGWPENYICDSPSSVRGNQIKHAHLPILMCHKTLVVTLSCIVSLLVIAIVVWLCHCLHCIWYANMTWAWLKAKRKPLKVTEREISFDAFISYSERDSEWVENMMVPQLENGNPPLRVCFHKRDFVPGKWIIDNIIDAMDRSYKTLFILSEHFVQSEWCKYELEFSHFRLFDENNDTAILVLLEPIEKSTIPKRFCKLRKLMNTKTYIEWPTEEEQQHVFWDNLKAAVQPEEQPEEYPET